MNNSQHYKTLKNGNKIPSYGFGTWQVKNGEETAHAVEKAIHSGYRLIDTATGYGNELGVGIGLKRCFDTKIIKRENLFITTKIRYWQANGYDETLKAFSKSLEKLGLDYVDLYLIHAPWRDNADWKNYVIDTWCAFEKLYKEGKIKAIGVSNFSEHHLEYLLSEAEIKPMINQIEIHPQHQQKELTKYCSEHGIINEAWGSLNQGKIFTVSIMKEMAKKYNKSIAQIALRWNYQKGFISLASSIVDEQIIENLNLFDFEISEQDMAYIDTLDGGEFSGWHTDTVQPEQTIPLSSLPDMLQDKPYIWKWKLFGFIPFVKIKLNKNKFKAYLFYFIPFFKISKKNHLNKIKPIK